MVYVDSIGHLIADDQDELHAFASEIGLKRSWYQADSGKHNHDPRFPHYDLTTERMKQEAILHGAIPVSPKFIVKKLIQISKQEDDQ